MLLEYRGVPGGVSRASDLLPKVHVINIRYSISVVKITSEDEAHMVQV